MAKFNQNPSSFGSVKPANIGESQSCAQCEAMLADVMDGTLSSTEQVQFDAHIAGCMACSQMLADAQRGAAWLELLNTSRPEPPAALLEQILARTTGQTVAVPKDIASLHAGDVSAPRTATILPFRNRMAAKFPLRSIGATMLQPRFAMTAAMAFFSIGLTLNLTGIRLNELHAGNLTPSSMKRSFYQADAHVVRYVDNLSAVYELESRVSDLQHMSDDDLPKVPEPKPNNDQPEQKRAAPYPGSGTSQQQGPPNLPDRLPFRSFVNLPALVRGILQTGELV